MLDLSVLCANGIALLPKKEVTFQVEGKVSSVEGDSERERFVLLLEISA